MSSSSCVNHWGQSQKFSKFFISIFSIKKIISELTCSDPHSCQRTTPWLQMFTRSMSCLYSHPCPFTQICIQAHLQQCCMDGWVCMCIKLVLMIKRSLHAFYSWKVSMMLPRKSCWSFFENAHCVNAIKSNAVCFMLCTVVQIE